MEPPPPKIDSAAIYVLATFTVSLWIALYIWTHLQFIMLPSQFNEDCFSTKLTPYSHGTGVTWGCNIRT